MRTIRSATSPVRSIALLTTTDVRPRKRGDLRQRLKSLREAFADRPMPPISVYEAGGLYFVSDW